MNIKGGTYQDTPLTLAIKERANELADLLENDPRVDITLENDEGFAPTYLATINRQKDRAIRMLKTGKVDFNYKIKNGRSLLTNIMSSAEDERHLDIPFMEFMVENDADVNVIDDSNHTVLDSPINSDYLLMVEAFLKSAPHYKNIALDISRALLRSKPKTLKALLKHKSADLTATNTSGFTLLEFALQQIIFESGRATPLNCLTVIVESGLLTSLQRKYLQQWAIHNGL